MKKIWIYLLALCSPLPTYADAPIVVELATESPLKPIAVSSFNNQNAGLPSAYLQQLRDVLLFDLNHNGVSYVVSQPEFAAHVIQVAVADKQISLEVLTKNQNGRQFEKLELTGGMAQDRRVIHQLAEAVQKAIFDNAGVATTRLLYTQSSQNANGQTIAEVWEVDYDGANPRQLTHENALCVTPSYIPPKPGYRPGNFLYTSYRLGVPKIFLASLKEGNGKRISTMKGNQLMAAINKQRDKIAFISDAAGNPDLFLLDFSADAGASSKPRQIFATRQSAQGSPAFHPNGKQIAFVSNKDGKPRIYLMPIPPEGATLKEIKPQLLTKQNCECSAPAWSPDGTKLAYSALIDGTRQICILELSSGESRQLTKGNGHKENPTWAPNSLHIAYNLTNGKQTDLYMLNLNQLDPVKLTSGPGEKKFPSWETR